MWIAGIKKLIRPAFEQKRHAFGTLLSGVLVTITVTGLWFVSGLGTWQSTELPRSRPGISQEEPADRKEVIRDQGESFEAKTKRQQEDARRAVEAQKTNFSNLPSK